MQNKTYTILLIRSNNAIQLGIDEITIPISRLPKKEAFSWRKWIEKGALGNTGWLMYSINLSTGTLQQAYSYTKKEWIPISQNQNFFSTLLNLKLQHIPSNERKKVGPPPPSDSFDRRPLWEPSLIIDGKTISNAHFDGWRTHWPKDNSEMSGKTIEVYLPKKDEKYPSYFPYWLQVSGIAGKAKIRIVDSGRNLFFNS